MPTAEQREAFAEALTRRLTTENRKLIAHAVGLTTSMVSNWATNKNLPEPEQVFTIEDVLDLPGGTLSRHLGYLPIGVVSVAAALDADPRLDDNARRALLAAYEAWASASAES